MLAAIAALAGCGGGGGLPIERTVGGARRLGAFVGPYSYEHFVRGELALAAGELEHAAEHFELARASATEDPLLLARLAEVRDALGDRAAAARAIEEGLRLDPRSEAVWMARGTIAERHQELDVAIESYARAADAGEGSEGPVIALARVLRESGAAERADAVLERYLAEHEGGAGAARARLSLALGRGDARAAGLAALEVARRAPGNAEEIERAIREALEAGHPTLAHRVVALLPEGSVPRALALEVAIAAGERSEAEALLASWAPTTPSEITIAARAWSALGEPAQAAELAELAIAEGGGAEPRVVLARARLSEGRLAEAAAIAASIPAGSSGQGEARDVIEEALRRAGLPALAAELRASPRSR